MKQLVAVELLSMSPKHSRKYRDDITAVVVMLPASKSQQLLGGDSQFDDVLQASQLVDTTWTQELDAKYTPKSKL